MPSPVHTVNRRQFELIASIAKSAPNGADNAKKQTHTDSVTSRRARMSSWDTVRPTEPDADDVTAPAVEFVRSSANERDEVKQMNSLTVAAECVHVLDLQIAERRQREAEARHASAVWESAAEDTRVRIAAAEAEAESTRAAALRAGARVIISQIAERDEQRRCEAEQREAEARAMIAYVNAAAAAEEQRRIEKIARGRQLMRAVVEENVAQIQARAERAAAEAAEDAKRIEYVREKEEKEAFEEECREQKRKAKEAEINALRARQERLADRQSVVDEIRARRYQNQKERNDRAAEERAARNRLEKRREMKETNDRLLAVSAERKDLVAKVERAELNRILEHQARAVAEDEQKRAEQDEKRRQHARALEAQMAQSDVRKQKAAEEAKKESADTKARLEAEKREIKAIQQAKLATLKAANIPIPPRLARFIK